MIAEDYASFEIAKLLKEKGFDKYPLFPCYKEDNGDFIDIPTTLDTINHCFIPAPTLQMAVKWLRVAYSIVIVVDYDYEYTGTSYCYKIYCLEEHGRPKRVPIKGTSYNKDNEPTEHIVGYRDYERSKSEYSTYEEACEAAINYCLKNLI